MWIINVIIVSETSQMENLWNSSPGQSVEITQQTYIRTYKYKEKGGYSIAIRPLKKDLKIL